MGNFTDFFLLFVLIRKLIAYEKDFIMTVFISRLISSKMCKSFKMSFVETVLVVWLSSKLPSANPRKTNDPASRQIRTPWYPYQSGIGVIFCMQICNNEKIKKK